MQFAMQWFVTYQFRIELFRIHIVLDYMYQVLPKSTEKKGGLFFKHRDILAFAMTLC